MIPRHTARLATALLTIALAAASLAADPFPGPCEGSRYGDDARCGSFPVFEDREARAGRRIDLNVVVLPATGPGEKEPLFVLAGGPGQGATDLAQVVLEVYSSVREHRDIVLVDQRGTGASGRIDCPVDAEESPQEVFGALFDPELTAACLEEVRKIADPTLYTTDLVVDDLEEIRQHLGYHKVFVWGTSGGTRTALVWMRRHPESVAGGLLDGVVPTDFRAPSTMARGCQETVDAVVAECRQQADCQAAYPDLAADFQQVLSLFDEGPVATHVVDADGRQTPVKMYRGDFAYAVRGVIYRSRSLAQLPSMIHQAAQTGDLHPFAQVYWQRQVGLRPYVAMGVHFGVYCSEDLPFIAEEEVAGFTEDTFVDRYLFDQYSGVCDIWQAKPVDASFLEPVESNATVLLVSGYYDPSTPISLGDQVAAHLPNSRHIKVRNESHGAEFGCAREAAIRFLETGSLEGLGPVCEDAGPVRYAVAE